MLALVGASEKLGADSHEIKIFRRKAWALSLGGHYAGASGGYDGAGGSQRKLGADNHEIKDFRRRAWELSLGGRYIGASGG